MGKRPTAEQMRVWHDAVMERDGYRCVVCGRRHWQAALVAHHMIPRSHSKAYITDPRNGATVCQGSGCFAHDRAHYEKEPYLYMWWDGAAVRWTLDRASRPPERERLAILASPANPC